jgi:hypothetical protein
MGRRRRSNGAEGKRALFCISEGRDKLCQTWSSLGKVGVRTPRGGCRTEKVSVCHCSVQVLFLTINVIRCSMLSGRLLCHGWSKVSQENGIQAKMPFS